MYRKASPSMNLALGVILSLCIGVVASAQFRASVQGTVKDASGAVVPNATVTVTNQETGRSQQVTSSDEGFYRVAGLQPGRYSVTAEATGFKKRVLEDVRVSAETTEGLDITIEAGQVSEMVNVTSGDTATQLQTETPNIARSITTEEIRRLPQFGRDPYELIRLTPGVFGSGARSGSGLSVGLPNTTGPGGSNLSIFQTENQVPVSANGQRVSANNYQIDGVSVNSLGFGGAAVVTPNQESVKEMRVLSSTYSAEDGRNTGAQIKVVSQNGTNEFHGSAFFKYNDPGLNAYNKYGGINGPPLRVENRFRQFGGSLGGPVLRERLFFFFSYEGLRNRTNTTFNEYVETPEFRQLVRNLRPGGVTARVFDAPGIEPRVVSVLPVDCAAFGNDPTRCRVVAGGLDIGSPVGRLGQYVSLGSPAGGGLDNIADIQFAQIALPIQARGDQYNTRFDFNRGTEDLFAVSTYFTLRNDVSSDRGSRSRPSSDLRVKPVNSAVTLTWNRIISATTLNEARLNFTRFAFDQVEASSGTNFGIPRIEVEGLPFDRIRFGADRSESTPAVFAQNTFEFRDTLSKVLNTHGLKAGVEVRKEQDNNSLAGGARPLYSFVGLFNLANDTPIFEAINADPATGLPADAQRYFRTSTYALFLQDDWKFRPNLTFNMGLRYEYFTPLRETRGRLSNLVFGSQGLADSRIEVTDELFEPDRNNFAPRLGFAWSPGRFRDRFVARGGFGVSYNRIPNVLFANTRGNPPFFARYNICCGTAPTDFGSPFAGGRIFYALGADTSPFSYPVNTALAQGIDPVTGAPRGGAVEIYGTEPEVPNAYLYSFSLDTEYNLPFSFIGAVGYQGSSGHKFIRLVNQNFIYDVRNPAFFAVYFPQPDVNTNYHAMNARLSRNFAQGFRVDAIYRWSKSIDTLSYEGPGFVTNQTNPRDLASERGPSDYDVRHYFVLSGLWEVPFLRGRNDLLGITLGGWEIDGVLTAHTGFPWTPVTGRAISSQSPGVSPTRPTRYFGGVIDEPDDEDFIRGIFPGSDMPISGNPGGTRYFDITTPGPPGIGRNSFRGPGYFSMDLSLVKRTRLPGALGLREGAGLELRANFFNAFNNLNLASFGFGSFIEDPNFGRSSGGLAGRVVELQARFRF